MSKQNIILLIFLFIGLMYLLWIAFKMFQKSFCSLPVKTVQEHFTTTEEETPAVSSEDTHYKNRMNVMKVFDTVLNRKPTSAELETYSAISNEQDLLVKVLADHKSDVVVKEETEAFAPVSEEALAKIESIVKNPSENETKVKQSTKVLEQLLHITTAVEEIKKLMS